MTKPPTWYEIPAGTRAAECRACSEPMFFVETARGSRVPVSCDVDGAFPPSDREGGRGVSHFATCTEPDRFSAGGRRG